MTSEYTRRAIELAIALTEKDRDERLGYLTSMLDRCQTLHSRQPIVEAMRKVAADYQHRLDTLVKLL